MSDGAGASVPARHSSSARSRVALALAAALLIFIGLRPFASYADAVPLQRDSLTWIEKSSPDSESGLDWSLRESHFIGYRPATALSFRFSSVVFGDSESALRRTDFALHGLAGLFVLLVAARLFGARAGLVAGAVFFAHPGADEVVPFLARRSYALATAGAFGGLLLSTFARERGVLGTLAFLAVGPALLLGMLGHELGAVLALALPVVAFASASQDRRVRAAMVAAWGAAWLALGVWIRAGVMEGVEGYPVGDDPVSRGMTVLSYFGHALGGRLDASGASGGIVLSVLGIYFVVASGWCAARSGRRVPLVLLAVIAAYAVIVAREAVWFPRQVYCASALMALFLAALARATWLGNASWGAHRLHAIPFVALLVLLLQHSPVVLGTGAERAARALAATELVQGVRGILADVEAPAVVSIAARVALEESVPHSVLAPVREGQQREERHMRVPFFWLKRTRGEEEVQLRELAYIVAVRGEAAATVETSGAAQLVLAPGVVAFEGRQGGVTPVPEERRTIRVRRTKKTDVHSYVWCNATTSHPGGQLLRIER